MNNIKLSIISTIYNVNKYLNLFLNSLIKFTKNLNYELILINDGSVENPEIIINQYKKKLKIKYIKTKNQGLGMARIEGYKNISKTSTHFVVIDPDDSIVENFNLLKYKNEINIYDIVTFDLIYKYESLKKASHYKKKLFGYQFIRPYGFKILASGGIMGVIYKNEKWIINDLTDTSRMFEDLISPNLLKYKSLASIKIINKPFINYLVRSNSIFNSKWTIFKTMCYLKQLKLLLNKQCLPKQIQKGLVNKYKNSISKFSISNKDSYKIIEIKRSPFRYFKLINIFLLINKYTKLLDIARWIKTKLP